MSDESWSKVETQQQMVDFTVTPSVSGVFVEAKKDIGPNLSMVYVLQQESGEELGVWGATLLDDLMAKVTVGTIVKIDFLGIEKTKDGKRTFKNFEVHQKKVPFTKVEAPAEGIKIEDIQI